MKHYRVTGWTTAGVVFTLVAVYEGDKFIASKELEAPTMVQPDQNSAKFMDTGAPPALYKVPYVELRTYYFSDTGELI